MGLPDLPTLGWLTGGQWVGIYGSPMERLGTWSVWHTHYDSGTFERPGRGYEVRWM